MAQRNGRDDHALVAACRKGDRGAWEELIQRYRRLIYSVPVSWRLDPSDCDGIFQRVALKLLEHVQSVRDPGALASWLTITARREVWALKREGQRTRGFEEGEAERMPEEPADVLADLHLIECEHALALAFERMPDRCRELLTLLYLVDPRPSYEDISERLGRPIGSLGPTRARCLKKLRQLYEQEGGEAPFEVEEEAGDRLAST